MPLTGITSDVSLEILALLPLSTLSILTSVRKAWKELVDENEPKVYRNAAALHGFIPSVNTSLEDALASLDFPVVTLQIRGWKQFCQIQLSVERNWTGLGPSKLTKMAEIGDNVHYRKVIADSGLTIVASFLGGIAVSDGYDTLWALPPGYLQGPTFFSYDQGYLVFSNPVPGGGIIDVWHDTSSHNFLSNPSGAQRVGAEASTFLYGERTVGHFVPCYSLPPLEEGRIDVTKKSVKVLYPTILAATKTRIHMWDISTGEYIRALSVKGDLDTHSMGVTGFEVSQEFVVAYDTIQLRLFSRHDGNFLYHFSKWTAFIPKEPPAVQLSPPRTAATAGQWDGAVLMQQVLFRKRRRWACPRGGFAQVGLSECGTTLVVVVENNRIFIIHELKRMVAEGLPIEDISFELKMAKEYGDPRTMSPAVTRDRIAIGTFRGILVLTLDRSKAGPAPTGSVRLETSSAVAPLQLAASFINLRWQSRDSNLHIDPTKLFFDAEPSTHVDSAIDRQPRKSSGRMTRRPWLEEPTTPSPEEDALSDQFDDMPELQSVSNSSDEEEDEDEESDWGVQEEEGVEEPPAESNDSSDSDGDDAGFSDIGSDDDLSALAPNNPPTQQPQPANLQQLPNFAQLPNLQPPNILPNLPQLFANALLPNGNFHMPPALPVLSSGFVINTAPES
ncbi:hypothetical protein C8F04DRAFT_1101890 [Mycena alexandri]|uniref:F-box domain-containing protein n=1 Tax=Mycena alexandri TaxID=1745969 RepID=A0AAD6SZ82_9AGAR|nr:hypothetical protein C8F04DRAFT_1101890 [Mycena alexandri]